MTPQAEERKIVLKPTCAWCATEELPKEKDGTIFQFEPTGKRMDYYCTKCQRRFLDADEAIQKQKDIDLAERKALRSSAKEKA